MPLGQERKRAAPFSFALPPLSFHGSGSGFRWIDTLDGGTFGICIPAFRAGERAERLYFVIFAPFHFTGSGRGVFGGSLHSATARLVDTCQRDGRGRALNRFIFASTVEFLRGGGARGKGFRWIATLGGGVFGTPPGREGKRGEMFCLRFHC